ncbi:MAG: hypothetical protein CMJ58_07245 [Planctomycetaceae bacterium]|nr:hypothetical protein [Planctomycetaceae bacterium]
MDSSSSPVVGPCPAQLLKPALRALHDGLTKTERPALVQALDNAGPDDFAGLIVARQHEEILAACWVQPTAGNGATVWAPCGETQHAAEVLAGAASYVDQRGIGIAQALIDVDDDATGAALAAAGFPQLAELAYLFAAAERRTSDAGASLTFHGSAGDDLPRLAALLAQTYDGSQDVPGLENARSIDDALAGYRAQGTHIPEHWYLVQCKGVDAAALLLAAHPAVENWELVYIGVAAQFRGRGLGRRIVDFAVTATHAAGAERLVLAVDAGNAPALAMYANCGFIEWDRRCVYARLRGKRASNHGHAS